VLRLGPLLSLSQTKLTFVDRYEDSDVEAGATDEEEEDEEEAGSEAEDEEEDAAGGKCP